MSSDEPLDAPLKEERETHSGSSFETKDGYCHVLKDRIILSYGKDPSDVKRNLKEEETRRNWILTMSLLTIMICTFTAFFVKEEFTSQNSFYIPLPVFFAIGAFGGLASFVSTFRRSFTPIILRYSIDYISVDEDDGGGILGIFSRKRFEIHFVDYKGRKWKRIVSLASKINGGHKERSKALSIFRREGLMD